MVFGISREKDTRTCAALLGQQLGLDTERVWFVLPGEIAPSESKLVLKPN